MIEIPVHQDGKFVGQLHLRQVEVGKWLVEWWEPECRRVGRIIRHNESDGIVKLLALAFNAVLRRLP